MLVNLGFVVVAEAGSVAEAVSTAQRVKPSAALVDVELPDGDVSSSPACCLPCLIAGIVVTSVQSGADFNAEARRVGAGAFVLKADLARAPLEELARRPSPSRRTAGRLAPDDCAAARRDR